MILGGNFLVEEFFYNYVGKELKNTFFQTKCVQLLDSVSTCNDGKVVSRAASLPPPNAPHDSVAHAFFCR